MDVTDVTDLTPDALAEEGSFGIRGLAKFLDCSERHAYRLVARKAVRSVRSGRRLLVPRASAKAYLAQLLDEAR